MLQNLKSVLRQQFQPRDAAVSSLSQDPIPPPQTHFQSPHTQNTETSKLLSTVNSKELLALKRSPPQTIPSVTKGTSCFLHGTDFQFSPLPNLCLLSLAENSSTDLQHLLWAARLQVLFYLFLCRSRSCHMLVDSFAPKQLSIRRLLLMNPGIEWGQGFWSQEIWSHIPSFPVSQGRRPRPRQSHASGS